MWLGHRKEFPEPQQFAIVNSLWQKANAWKVSFRNSLRWLIYTINSVDKTNLSCYTPPPTQHRSFFRNLPPLFLYQLRSPLGFKVNFVLTEHISKSRQ